MSSQATKYSGRPSMSSRVGGTRHAWLGFVVLARHGTDAYKRVSGRFDTRAGAESFLALYLQSFPDADAYIDQLLRGRKA